MKLLETRFKGAKLIELEPFTDERGSFSRLFCKEQLSHEIIQLSIAHTKAKGTLRGLHFQKEPFSEDKLVYCLSGRFFTALVDLRPDSATFKDCLTLYLEPGKGFLAPKGFAHGCLSLEDNCSLLYGCSEKYSPEHASGVLWCDPELNIEWPLAPCLISAADQNQPPLHLLLQNQL